MYTFAYLLLVASFLFAVAVTGLAAAHLLMRRPIKPEWPQYGHIAVTGLMTVCSVILTYAFVTSDFSLEYVASYSELSLPMFYKVTAFWAGQSGSMLFWAWSVAIGGLIFSFLPAYKNLGEETKLWFWVFFYAVTTFFLLLLTAWQNPFELIPADRIPADGRGLNPLLQNPGMILHPPLLFLGYGGFVVPGCLALAQSSAGTLTPGGTHRETPWGVSTRTFILVAWLLLTAGIILGAWWAYMELGWGGYWAWDPVENASLIPWLAASAYLHTAVIESRRGKLRRTNVFLMNLATVSAFFATYLVRSGVIESLHAFGDGGVGKPLLVFTFVYLALASLIALFAAKEDEKELEELHSKEGMLVLVCWILLALSFLILIATLWPVIVSGLLAIAPHMPAFIANKLPASPMGLEPAFYNRTCLPMFAALSALLVFCPTRKWKETAFSAWRLFVFMGAIIGFAVVQKFLPVGMKRVALEWAPLGGILLFTALAFPFKGPKNEEEGPSRLNVLRMTLLLLGLGAVLLFASGVRQGTTLIGAATAFAAVTGIVMLFASNPSLLSIRTLLAAHGVHIGLLLMVIGVAFSGPFQIKQQITLGIGETAQVGAYTLKLADLQEGEYYPVKGQPPHYSFKEASLLVLDGKRVLGKVTPQLRSYTKHKGQDHLEVATLFSFGNEVYATLTGIDAHGHADLAVHINPLVNWLWIGGILMCLFPFLGLSRTFAGREKQSVKS